MNTFAIKLIILPAIIFANYLSAQTEYVDFTMMNQEIRHALEEYDRQEKMLEKQINNFALETTNKSQWNNFKNVTTKIQSRLHFLDLTVQSIPAGYEIFLKSQKIYSVQEKIINEIRNSPILAVPILEEQIELGDELQMVLRFLAGIIVSYGDINQMEKAERKILIDHALNEVTSILYKSNWIYYKIIEFKNALAFKKNAIEYYINKDKNIVNEIIENINNF